jgi:hypothetical protein
MLRKHGRPLACGWVRHRPGLGGKFCRVIFDKMQGGPTYCIAESHGKELEELLPKQRAGGIAGKSGVAKGPDQGTWNCWRKGDVLLVGLYE